MFLEFSFVFFYFLAVLEGILCTDNEGAKLIIVTAGGEKNPPSVVHNVTETLELVCYLTGDDTDKYNMTWVLPKTSRNSIKHSNVHQEGSTTTLKVKHLDAWDSGDYVCKAENNDTKSIISQLIRLNVTAMRNPCEKMFICGPNTCIAPIFECDGVIDCENEADEDPARCGPKKCEGKIQCNNRCIPVALCCFPYELNCTIKIRPTCCPSIKPGYIREESVYLPPNYSDMNFLQTAIYSVVGCAILFVVIVTAFVVAIYRIHLRRTLLSTYPQRRDALLNTRYHRTFTHDMGVRHLGVYMNRGEIPANLLVTYNINNGLQILGEAVDPPPYSEVQALPREYPPPPYSPTDEYRRRRESSNSGDRISPKPEDSQPTQGRE